MRKLAQKIIVGFALIPFNSFAQNSIIAPLKYDILTHNILSKDKPKLEIDNSPYQSFSIDVKKGQRLKVNMNSSDFSPIFMIGEIENNKICSKCTISDMIDKNNSIGLLDIDKDGQIIIRATTANPNELGNFSLIVQSIDKSKFEAKEIKISETIKGVIQYDDELGDNDDLMDNFFIELKKNDFLEIDLISEDFDPRLVIIGDNGFYKLDFNGGIGNNSKLVFHAPQAGKYYIRALSELSKIGKYELRANIIENPKTIKALPVLFGRKNTYSLNSNDIETYEGDKIIAKRFKLLAKKGKKYWLDAQSNEIDLKLEIGTQTKDGNFYIIQEDENSGENSNPLIFFTAQEDGEYLIRIGANPKTKLKQEANMIGNFSFIIKEAIENPLPKSAKSIQIGQTFKDKFLVSGTRNFENRLVKFYSLRLKEGQNAQIELKQEINTKKPIDPYLIIATGSPNNFEALIEDDDSGGQKNALIKFKAPKTQQYLIIARAQTISAEGDYTLSTKLILNMENEIKPIK